MRNDRLREAIEASGLTRADIADELRVDPKTVERWITKGRVPYPRLRGLIEELLDATGLWPQREQAELIDVFAERAAVPRDTWLGLLDGAREHIDVLVFSGTFFVQTQPHVAEMLAAAVARGVQVRLCFGDPRSDAVALRDREEGLGGTLAAKIRASLTYYRAVAADGCAARLHATTLYASLFRYDDELLANPHVYGAPASLNPVLHLRHGRLFEAHMAGFERAWAAATPWHGEQV